MSVYKSEDNTSWYVMTRYTNYKGERKQKCKRGFTTKREAQEWERSFNMQKSVDMDMTFEDFLELYKNDKKPRVKENTWLTKEYIINLKILPHFAKRKICEITPKMLSIGKIKCLPIVMKIRNLIHKLILKHSTINYQQFSIMQ